MADEPEKTAPAAATTEKEVKGCAEDDAVKAAEETVDETVKTGEESVDQAVKTAGEEIASAEKKPEEQVTETVKSLIEGVKESLTEVETEVEKVVVGFDPSAQVKSLGTAVESFVKGGTAKDAGESSQPASAEETEKPRSLDTEEKSPATTATTGRASWANCCGLLELFTQNR